MISLKRMIVLLIIGAHGTPLKAEKTDSEAICHNFQPIADQCDIIPFPMKNYNERRPNPRYPEENPIKGIMVHCVGAPKEAEKPFYEAIASFQKWGVSANALVAYHPLTEIQQQAKAFLDQMGDNLALFPQGALSEEEKKALEDQQALEDFKKALCETVYNFKGNHPDRAPIIGLVPLEKRSWHAGLSTWGPFGPDLILNDLKNQVTKEFISEKVVSGEVVLSRNKEGILEGTFRDEQTQQILTQPVIESLNSSMIGIEFHSPDYAKGEDFYSFGTFSPAQRKTGLILLKYLQKEFQIPLCNIMGHSDGAPGRKTDPGPGFFWKEMEKEGLKYLPEPSRTPLKFRTPSEMISWIQEKLLCVGYSACPQNGQLTEKTAFSIDAYRGNHLTKECKLIGVLKDFKEKSLEETCAFFITPRLIQTLESHSDDFQWRPKKFNFISSID